MQSQRQRNIEEQREETEPFFKPTNSQSQDQQSFFLFGNDSSRQSESVASSSGITLFQVSNK